MDEGFNERNAASRARLSAVGGHLIDDALSTSLDGPWSAGSVFAHIAFWDRFVHARWKLAHRDGTGVPGDLDDALWDLVNDAALPQWTLGASPEGRAAMLVGPLDPTPR